MDSKITLTTNGAKMVIDFEEKKIVFDRNASSEYVIGLIPMEINFSDITDIELKNPKLLAPGQCNIIVKGIRYVTADEKYDMTRFLSNDFNALKNTLSKVLAECGLNGFKEYRSVNAPKVIYANVLGEFETRKKCQNCGHIFCYSPLDLRENKMNNKIAAGYGLSGTLRSGSVGGSLDQMNAQNARNNIRDFNCCPQCNSRALKTLSKEEYAAEMQAKSAPAYSAPAPAPSISSADELKKYKELLDMGIITQEEFDAKKKQLLGL